MTDVYEWKAGQAVWEASRGWGAFPGRKLTIDRVTPSGRAVIGSTQYDPDGTPRGDRYSNRIVPFTDEHQAELDLFKLRTEARDLADKIKWADLEADDLKRALPILQAITKDKS